LHGAKAVVSFRAPLRRQICNGPAAGRFTVNQTRARQGFRSGALPEVVARVVSARSRRPEFQRWLRERLVELCRVNTTPNPDVAAMRAAEDACFRIL
jgi:hypothetical protein